MEVNNQLKTEIDLEKDLERKVDDYNKKCYILGVKPLTIQVKWGKAVLTDADESSEEIVLPYFVNEIEACVFQSNRKLRKISGKNVRIIGLKAFSNCENLEEVSFPNLRIIEDEAFRNTKIGDIDFEYVIEVGRTAFTGCDKITTINLPEAVYVGEEAFRNCDRLERADLPKLAVLRMYTFRDCKELLTINIPNIVKIQDYATLNCDKLSRGRYGEPRKRSLKDIKIPTEVNGIDGDAFKGYRKFNGRTNGDGNRP